MSQMMSFADFQQKTNQDPGVRKIRKENKRIAGKKKDILVEEARKVIHSPNALVDVIEYINECDKKGTLDHDEVMDLIALNPSHLVWLARR